MSFVELYITNYRYTLRTTSCRLQQNAYVCCRLRICIASCRHLFQQLHMYVLQVVDLCITGCRHVLQVADNKLKGLFYCNLSFYYYYYCISLYLEDLL